MKEPKLVEPSPARLFFVRGRVVYEKYVFSCAVLQEESPFSSFFTCNRRDSALCMQSYLPLIHLDG